MLNFFINTAHAGVWDPIMFKSSIGLDISLCPARPDGTFLACYISSLYTFFVQAAIILAVFMIMFGGFQWMMALGDSGKISNAKSTITEAIWGLVLALVSYVLFAQINSNLVNLQNLDIQPVEIIPRVTTAVPGGYCPLTGEQPDLSRLVQVSSLWNAAQQKTTFHPSLIKVMNKLNSQLVGIPWNTVQVGLSSISDGNIWSVDSGLEKCHRDVAEGPLLGACQHSDSYHYGGPRNKCAFNDQYPPVSCAVDLTVQPTFYAKLQYLMDSPAVGFDYTQCEKTVTDDQGHKKNVKTDCVFSWSINHIHGEMLVDNCEDVRTMLTTPNNPATPATDNPNQFQFTP